MDSFETGSTAADENATIAFPLSPEAADRKTLRFAVVAQMDLLPDGPGLFVLMGRHRPDAAERPLAFGAAEGSLLRELPRRAEFAAAIREGLVRVATAPLPANGDGARLAEILGHVHQAPINIRQSALREIDAARLPEAETVPLAAE